MRTPSRRVSPSISRHFRHFSGGPASISRTCMSRRRGGGGGLGRGLLAHVAAVAVDRGYGRMEWSVLDWNELALDVYRKIGARPMDEWTVQRLTGDALRDLASSV